MAGVNKRFYKGKASAWGLGFSSSGKEQIAVTFSILTEGATHQSLTWYGYFTDATFDRTIESLRHMGWTGDNLDELRDGTQGALNANEVDLVVEDEEYEGKWQTKIQWVNKAGGLALKAAMDEQQARSFGASMRGKIRALDASKNVKPAPAAPKPNGARSMPPQPPHTLAREPGDDDMSL